MYDGSLDWRQTKHNYTYQTYHNPPLTLLAHRCTVESRGVLSTVSGFAHPTDYYLELVRRIQN